MSLSITARVVSVSEGPSVSLGIAGNEDVVVEIRDSQVLPWAQLLGQDVELAVRWRRPVQVLCGGVTVAETSEEISQLQAGGATLCTCFAPYCDPASCPAHAGGKVSPDFDGVPKWPEATSAAESPETAAESPEPAAEKLPQTGAIKGSDTDAAGATPCPEQPGPVERVGSPQPKTPSWRAQLPPASEWMTVAEWAEHVSVSSSYAYGLAKKGRIPTKPFPTPQGLANSNRRPTILMVPAATTRPQSPPPAQAEKPRTGDEAAEPLNGRDGWCAALSDALEHIEAGTSRGLVAARRCVLRSIDDCLMPVVAAKTLGVGLPEWRGASSAKALGPFFEAHGTRAVAVARELLEQRGLPELQPPTVEEFLGGGAS